MLKFGATLAAITATFLSSASPAFCQPSGMDVKPSPNATTFTVPKPTTQTPVPAFNNSGMLAASSACQSGMTSRMSGNSVASGDGAVAAVGGIVNRNGPVCRPN